MEIGNETFDETFDETYDGKQRGIETQGSRLEASIKMVVRKSDPVRHVQIKMSI